jgi:hemolysin activation/secretion protein
MSMNKKKKAHWRVWAPLLSAWPAMAAQAAGVPDAGVVQQQIEQTLKQPARPAASVPSSAAQGAPAGQQQVQVRAFGFVGNQRVSTATLESAVQPFLGQSLDMAGIQRAVEAVRQVYREAGWMAHVFLPAQDVTAGRIQMEISEAVLGQARVLGSATHLAPGVVDAVLAEQLAPGQPIAQARLERALMLLGDLPGVAVTSSFARGAVPGQTDLLVTVDDKSNFSGSVALDNQGSSGADKGRALPRLVATLNVGNPLQWGDQASLSALKAQGSEYARAGYTVPVGPDGWRLGAYASRMAYDMTASGAQFSGNANTYGFNASYPLLRSQARNVSLSSTLEEKSFENRAVPGDGSEFRIRVANVSASVNGQDGWLGGGLSSAVLGLSAGEVKPITQLPDASTQGHYSKWTLALSRMQALSSTLSASLLFNLQRSGDRLDSSEKMYFGGAYGVRAYPMSEGPARNGESLSLEVTQRLDEGLSVSGFYDYGRGRDPQSADEALRRFHIKGWGASVAWQANAQTQIKAVAAHRLGNNPLPNSTYGANRLWLSANYAF